MLLNKDQAWEFSLLALCIWREGRNQPFRAKRGIGWAVRNRVFHPTRSWWGSDWEDVILKPWQFSSFNPTDPNAVKFPGDPHGRSVEAIAWRECLSAAEDVYTSQVADPTGGATHYHTVGIEPPKWTQGAIFTVQLGDHLFYKGVA